MEIATLASGSSGNCTYIASGRSRILIDAGISMRRINSVLKGFGTSLGHIDAILITHEHTDHIKALPMIEKYYKIPIFASEGTSSAIGRMYPQLGSVLFPFAAESEINIGCIKASAFSTPHDAAQSVGYKISDGKSVAVLATDIGYVSTDLLKISKGSDMVLIESNHDINTLLGGIYPYHLKQRILSQHGHLSNDECAKLVAALAKGGTRRFLLCHLSRENNTPGLAYSASRDALAAEGFTVGSDIYLEVAPAFEPTARYII